MFPVEEPGTTGTTPKKARPKTHKLAGALKACAKKKPKKQRATCERQARKRYGPKL